MKKLLALVLALVMTMSLCITSNAAYTDAADIDYKEAVDVMTAIGVLEGSDGKFSPKAELTRAQAAKIIAYLELGNKVAAALQGSGKVFSDVPASHWACGYIEYLASEGVLAGTGNGKFEPESALTNAAFAKMLLVVLGCEQDADGLTGASWVVKTAKLAEQSKIFDGADVSINAIATRQQAALFAFNAITKGGEYYGASTGTQIDVNGTKISTDMTPSHWDGNNSFIGSYADVKYTKLDKSTTTTTDDFGRPATKWTYDTKEVGVYGSSSADKAFVATAAKTGAADSLAQFNKDLGLKKNSEKLEYATGYDFVVNGDDHATKNLVKGDSVELFLDDDGDIETVVIVRDTFAQIDVTEKKATKNEGAYTLYKVDTTNQGKVYSTVVDDEEDTAVVTGTVADDDYVLYHKVAGKFYVKAAETVEGEVTAVKDGKACIGGTYYTIGTGVTATNGTKGTWALDAAGALAADVEVVSKSSDYAYVYTLVKSKDANKANDDGYLVSSAEYTAYMVLADGTKASYVIDKDSLVAGKFGTKSVAQFVTDNDFVGKMIAYSVDKDDELVVETAADGTGSKSNSGVNKNSALIDTGVYANADTKFVFMNKTSDNKMKVTVATGYKNVVTDGSVGVAYAFNTDTKYASLVFVNEANGDATSDMIYAVMMDSKFTQTKDDDGTYYTFAVVIDGEETTLTVDNSTDRDALKVLDNGTVFKYKLTDKDVSDLATVSVFTTTAGGSVKKATVVNADYIFADSTEYTLADDAKVYTVAKSVDDGDTTYTVEDGEIAKDDLFVVADKKVESGKADQIKVAFIFVDLDA